MTAQETLAELVAIDSVSSRSNATIIDYLARRCELTGFSIKRFPYQDSSGVDKFNLIALAGADFSAPSPSVELALVGHTDTVPYDANWIEALSLTERDGKLFGRGACDTKAFIAATLTAVQAIDWKSLKRPLALVFTADEEVGLIGAKRLADERALEARYAIVGEPTSLQPIRAGKGYCLAEITIAGREGHSAYPHLGTSAVFGAARLISSIEGLAKTLETDRHAAFDPPFTTLNVGVVRGGTAKIVIPGECRFTLEWRPIPGQDPGHLLNLINQAIADQKKLYSDFSCEVDASRADHGFETSPESTLVKLLEELTGNQPGTVAFGTEAAQLTQLGAESVVLGPGNIRVAHRTGEFVPRQELENCVGVLSEAISRICL
jgi:acetylornithine deacetylase